jgi:hypothetical protein
MAVTTVITTVTTTTTTNTINRLTEYHMENVFTVLNSGIGILQKFSKIKHFEHIFHITLDQ